MRHKAGILVGALILATAMMIAQGELRGERQTFAAGPVIEVNMTETGPFRWQPSGLTVQTGTTVKWNMAGPAPHTVTSDGCGAAGFGPCTFDSGTEDAKLLRAGTATASFQYTFDKPGVYPFYCRIHGTPGLVGQAGTVVVYEPGLAPLGALPGRPELLQPKASVAILSPQAGQVVAGDRVTVNLNVQGATLRNAITGVTDPGYGHYHLILDTNVDLKEEIPRQGSVPGVYHVFGNSFTLESLRPGPHTLMVVWGFDNHYPSIQPITSTVSFTTVAGITPPSTGDAGLIGNSDGEGVFGAIAAGFLVAAYVLRSSYGRFGSVNR